MTTDQNVVVSCQLSIVLRQPSVVTCQLFLTVLADHVSNYSGEQDDDNDGVEIGKTSLSAFFQDLLGDVFFHNDKMLLLI